MFQFPSVGRGEILIDLTVSKRGGRCWLSPGIPSLGRLLFTVSLDHASLKDLKFLGWFKGEKGGGIPRDVSKVAV